MFHEIEPALIEYSQKSQWLSCFVDIVEPAADAELQTYTSGVLVMVLVMFIA